MNAFDTARKIVFLRLNSLDYVPSGLYSSEILAEHAYDVLAVEYGFFDKAFGTTRGKIPRLRLGHPFLRRLPRVFRPPLLHFIATLRVISLFAWSGRPRLVIAEGLHEQVIALLSRLLLGVPYVVHVHEVYESKEVRGWNRLFLVLEGLALRNAQFTIFPEAQRAQIYRERYAIDGAQYIAFNCPRRNETSQSIDWRARLRLPVQSKLLGYWGGQGKTNALEQAIRAVARLPHMYFLLWGWSSGKDREYFQTLATGVGAAHRVLFLGELPDDKWGAIAGLDVSYCVYEPRELRLRHLATASNKLMESLAVGVPVIASGEPDFRKVVEHHDVGLCAPDFTVEGIFQTLRDLTGDEASRRRRSENALRCHSEVFHYETQFQPVLRAVSRLLHPAAVIARGETSKQPL